MKGRINLSNILNLNKQSFIAFALILLIVCQMIFPSIVIGGNVTEEFDIEKNNSVIKTFNINFGNPLYSSADHQQLFENAMSVKVNNDSKVQVTYDAGFGNTGGYNTTTTYGGQIQNANCATIVDRIYHSEYVKYKDSSGNTLSGTFVSNERESPYHSYENRIFPTGTYIVYRGNFDTWGYYYSMNFNVYNVSKASVQPTLTAYSGTYDGQPHTVTLSGVSGLDFHSASDSPVLGAYYYQNELRYVQEVAGGVIKYSTDGQTWSTTAPTRTEAGTTTVYSKVEENAYLTGGITTSTITVSKAASTAPTLTTYTGNYDGSPHTVSVSGGSGGTIYYSTGSQGPWSTTIPTRTNAGTTTVYAKIVGDSNHNDSGVVSADIKINKTTATKPQLTSYSKIYNASATAIGVSAGSGGTTKYRYSSDNGSIWSAWSTTKPSITDVGKIEVEAKTVGDSNHNDSGVATGSVTITAKEVSPTWGTDTTFTYDGTAKAPTAGSTSVISGQTVNFTRTTAITAGSHTSTASISSVTGGKTSNYTITGNTKAFTINRASVTKPASQTYTYSSASQGITGLSGYNSTWGTSSGTTSAIDVGNYSATAYLKDKTNYVWNDGTDTDYTYTWKITPYAVTPGWGATRTFTYNRGPQAPSASQVNGVGSEKVNFTRTTETNVGEYTSTASISGVTGGQGKISNYSITGNTLGYRINAKNINDSTINISLSYNECTYDGSAKVPTVTVTDGSTVLQKDTEYELSYSKNTNAGTADVLVTGIGNYIGSKTVHFTINKYTPNISINNSDLDVDYSRTREIRATSDVAGKWVVTSNGPTYVEILEGNNASVSAGGSTTIKYKGIKATESSNTITIQFVPNDTANYNGGTLTHTVTKVNKIPAINPNIIPTREEYNGEYISITQTGGDGGTFEYCTSEDNSTWGSWSTTIPSRKEVGVTYVKVRVIADSNHIDSVPSESYSMVVSKRALAVAANSKFKYYKEADPELDYVYANNLDGQIPAFTGTLAREKAGTTEGENAGTYKILRNTLDIADNGEFKANNYYIIYVQNLFTIQRMPIYTYTASLSYDTHVYNGEELKPTVTVTDEDGVELVKDRDYEVVYSNNKNVGNGIVTINGINNYTGTLTKNFEITKKAITVTADDKTKTYKQADATLTYTVDGIVSGESLNDVTISRVAGETVGTYAINVTVNNSTNSNYDITLVNGTYTINPKSITAKMVVSETNFIYDGTEKKPTVTVYDPDDDELVPASEYEVIYADNKDVGTGSITLSDKEGGNYIVSGTRNIVVGKKNVTLRAENKSKTYKDSDPELTYVVDDIVSGEELNDVTISRVAGETVGTYAINVGVDASTNPNYNITLQNGTFTINPKTITADIVLDEENFIYDGTNKEPSVTAYDPDDNALVPDTEYEITYTNNKNVGTGKATISDKTGGNYIVSGEKEFTIGKRTITVTADDKTKTYKDADETLTYSVDNIVGGETLSSITLSREAGENVGTYTINVSKDDSVNPNYDITLVNGTYTINPKTITAKIVLDEENFIYDGTEREPSVTVYDPDDDMLVPDTEYEVTYTNNKDVGTGSVTISDKEGGNYIVNGTKNIVISKKAITLTADSKQKYYKQDDEELTYTVTGIVEDESLNDVTISRVAGETVGTYTINVEVDNSTNPNYDITLVNGTYTIDPKPITAKIIIEQSDYVYDGTERRPLVAAFDPDDNMLIPDTEYEIEYVNNTNAGTGKVVLQNKEGGNYVVSGEKEITISKREVTITADDKEKVYGEIDETLTYTIEGLLEGQSIAGIEISREAGEEAGEYVITVTAAEEGNENFDITCVPGTYTIKKKDLKENAKLVIVDNISDYVYDGKAKEPSIEIYTIDTNEKIPSYEYEVIYDNNTNAGTATISVSSLNYDITASKTFTIERRNVVLNPNNKQKKYGEDDPELTYIVNNIVSGEELNGINIVRESGEEIGQYIISASEETGSNPNYLITFNNATFTIIENNLGNKITIEIQGDSDTLPYKEGGQKPKIKVYDNETNKVIPADEYDVTYENVDQVGTATIKVKSKDNSGYKFEGTKTFIIADDNVPIIKGVKSGESYAGDTEVEIIDSTGSYTVTDNGNEVTLVNNKFIIEADNKQHTIIVKNKVGNEAKVKIYVFKSFTVAFLVDGKIIKTVSDLKYGDAVTDIPKIPTKAGYDETAPRWDKDVSYITSNLIVHAIYYANGVSSDEDNYTDNTPNDISNNDINNESEYSDNENDYNDDTEEQVAQKAKEKIKIPEELINQTKTLPSNYFNTINSINTTTDTNIANNANTINGINTINSSNVGSVNNSSDNQNDLGFLFGLNKVQLIITGFIALFILIIIALLELILIPALKKDNDEDNDDDNNE